MKRTIQIFSLLIFIFIMGGCAQKKSVFKKPKVTKEDFYYATIDSLQKWDAVILDENTRMQREILYTDYQNSILHQRYNENYDIAWVTRKERKILILSDSINSKEIGVIDYYNPIKADINTLHTLNMYLYTFNENGKIKHRKVEKHEIIDTRVNDSTRRVQLNFKENLAGKILVQQYKSIYPAAEKRFQQTGVPHPLVVVPSHIFQNSLPLLSGKYEVLVPKYNVYDHDFEIGYEFKQLGSGELKILDKNTKEYYYGTYTAGVFHEERNRTYEVEREELETGYYTDTRFTNTNKEVNKKIRAKYNALKVTATVSNVMPLTNGSDEQPLGIRIIQNPIRK